MDEALTQDSFAAMLGGEGAIEQPETESQNAEPEQETDEEAAPEPEQEEAEAEAEAEPEPEPEPEEQPEKDSADALIELEINGEKLKLTKDEVKNGYLRQQDYTQKAQILARERQEAHQHFQQQAAQITQMSAEITQLSNIDAQLNQYKDVDWQALREADPLSYSTHRAEVNDLRFQRGEVTAAIGQKQQALTQAQQQASAQAFAQQTQEASQHLAKVIPGFGKEHLAQMKDFGQKTGFSAEELGHVADKRMLEILWKASEYDKGQAKTAQVIKKVAALPTKANKPAPASKPQKEVAFTKQLARVKSNGNARDFAALLDLSN